MERDMPSARARAFVVINAFACATMGTASWFGGAVSTTRPTNVMSAVAFAVAAVSSIVLLLTERRKAAIVAGTATVIATLGRAAVNIITPASASSMSDWASWLLRVTVWLWVSWLLWLAWATWLVPLLVAMRTEGDD